MSKRNLLHVVVEQLPHYQHHVRLVLVTPLSTQARQQSFQFLIKDAMNKHLHLLRSIQSSVDSVKHVSSSSDSCSLLVASLQQRGSEQSTMHSHNVSMLCRISQRAERHSILLPTPTEDKEDQESLSEAEQYYSVGCHYLLKSLEKD